MLTKTDKRTKYQRLRDEGKLSGTIKECVMKRDNRAKLKEKPEKPAKITRIEFGPRVCRWVREVVQGLPEHSKKENWESPEPSNDLTKKQPFCHIRNHGRYSSRCTFDRITYAPVVRCCGIVTQGRLLWFFGNSSAVMLAARGWRFGKDDVGLYVVRVNETRQNYRYHFTMDDIQDKRVWVIARSHEDDQKQRARQQAAHEKQQKDRSKYRQQAVDLGVWVTYRDSRESGNCAAGTATFCRDNGLDIRSAYPVKIVERFIQPTNAYLVQRAIEAAVIRSADDLARGYCVIGE